MATERRDALAGAAGRVGDMQRRLDERLERAGVDEAGRARVLDVSGRAMRHRVEVLADEAHYDALHPARTLLILLDDCDVSSVALLEAAASIESEHQRLRVAPAGALATAVPLPDRAGEALAEDLVTADEATRIVALAERLDHARHLHLREPSSWRAFHASIGDVYLPVAQRTHERLAERYAWWWRMFADRFLNRPEAR